jgi:hypothetical protein
MDTKISKQGFVRMLFWSRDNMFQRSWRKDASIRDIRNQGKKDFRLDQIPIFDDE